MISSPTRLVAVTGNEGYQVAGIKECLKFVISTYYLTVYYIPRIPLT